MAPRTRNSDKKRRPLHRRELRIPRREIPLKQSATVICPPPNYENLILFYLTKLKRLFTATDHPHPKVRENSADKMRREQLQETKSKSSNLEINANKYTASHTAPKPREEDALGSDIKEKVYNVVNAAIEYGFANDVLEKRGDCFIFKNRRHSKIANRQLTPGPSAVKRSYCSHCSCNNRKSGNTGSSNNVQAKRCARPMSDTSASLVNCSSIRNSVHESKTQHHLAASGGTNKTKERRSSRSMSCTVGRNNYKSRFRRTCTCAKCRALEQRRKMQKK